MNSPNFIRCLPFSYKKRQTAFGIFIPSIYLYRVKHIYITVDVSISNTEQAKSGVSLWDPAYVAIADKKTSHFLIAIILFLYFLCAVSVMVLKPAQTPAKMHIDKWREKQFIQRSQYMYIISK